MIVVRELLLGPKRFSDIQRDVIGIGPAVLTQRLQDLEASGIVQRRRLPGPGRIDVYELTEWGYGLEAVNTALSLWAVASPALSREVDMSPDTVVVGRCARTHGRCPSARRSDVSRWSSRIPPPGRPAGHLPGADVRASHDHRPVAGPEPTDAEVSTTTQDWKACVIGGVPLERLPKVARVRQRRPGAATDQCDVAEWFSGVILEGGGVRLYGSCLSGQAS